jgi:hypothetical protein
MAKTDDFVRRFNAVTGNSLNLLRK